MKFTVKKASSHDYAEEIELSTLEDLMGWIENTGEIIIVTHPSLYGLPPKKRPHVELKMYDSYLE